MARDPNCIFCRIVAVEIPAAVVYEDEAVIAFLDIGPLAEGHLLMTPKVHYADVTQIPPSVAANLGAALPPLGRALLKVTGAEGFNVLCNQGRSAGQVVQHVHFHLIPRKSDDGLGFRWNAGSYEAGRAEELVAAFQKAIANA